jgi:hypothetical protein
MLVLRNRVTNAVKVARCSSGSAGANTAQRSAVLRHLTALPPVLCVQRCPPVPRLQQGPSCINFNPFRAKLLATRKAVNFFNDSSGHEEGEGRERQMITKLWFANFLAANKLYFKAYNKYCSCIG